MDSIGEIKQRSPATARLLRIGLWALLLLAAAEFVVRGPVRYLTESSEWNDFSQNYTASKLWLRGQSPANPKHFISLWKEQTHVRLDLTDIRTHLAPPLGGLLIMAPVAAFPWNIAKILWLAVSLLSFGAIVGSLLSISGQRLDWAAQMLFVAACLALAPFHTGIANGNTSVLVIGLCALGIWAADKNREIASGVFFGLACCLKPQIGAFLVLNYLVRSRWRLFATAVGLTITLTAFAAFYLRLNGASWIQDYLNNARGFVTSNNIDSFTSDNPARFSLINLQVPFFAIAHHSGWANLLALGVTGILVCAWLFLVRKDHRCDGLLSLAAVSTVALLPVYHRSYDAGLLAISLLWCIGHVLGPFKIPARCGLLCISPFLFPGSAILQQLASVDKLPHFLADSWLWTCVIMPHETWGLVMLCITLLYAMKANRPVSIKN